MVLVHLKRNKCIYHLLIILECINNTSLCQWRYGLLTHFCFVAGPSSRFHLQGGNRIQALAFNARRSEQRQQPGDFLLSSCQWQLVSQPAVSLLCQSPAMVRDEKTQRLVERRAGRVNFGVTCTLAFRPLMVRMTLRASATRRDQDRVRDRSGRLPIPGNNMGLLHPCLETAFGWQLTQVKPR